MTSREILSSGKLTSPLIATEEQTNLWFLTDDVKHVTFAKTIYQKVENARNKIAQEKNLFKYKKRQKL